MPRHKPLPTDDPEFDAEIVELKALGKEIDRAAEEFGDLIADRDAKVIEVLEKWGVAQGLLGEAIGMKRDNVSRIVKQFRKQGSGAKKSTSRGGIKRDKP